MQKRRLAYFCSIFILNFLVANASVGMTSSACDQAAKFASEKTGVPFSVLRAISWAETGHTNVENQRFGSWPWAVHAMGRGHWLSNQKAAVSLIADLIAKGERNIDVGCFQLNFHWHGSAFQNLDAMINPEGNALYAAHFLQKLYKQSGDWRQAVGQYHSQDQARAYAYTQRVKTVYNTHIGAAPPDEVQIRPASQNIEPKHYKRFGLIRAKGALISSQSGTRPLIGGRR